MAISRWRPRTVAAVMSRPRHGPGAGPPPLPLAEERLLHAARGSCVRCPFDPEAERKSTPHDRPLLVGSRNAHHPDLDGCRPAEGATLAARSALRPVIFGMKNPSSSRWWSAGGSSSGCDPPVLRTSPRGPRRWQQRALTISGLGARLEPARESVPALANSATG